MSARRAVVSGVGFVTSIGNDRDSVAASLRDLRSGIEPFEFIGDADLPVKVAGTIKGFDTASLQWAGWTWPEGYSFGRDALRGMPPHGLYALCATEQAVADARLTGDELAADDTGLFCGSAGSPRLLRHFLNQIHDSRGARVSPMGIVSTIAGTLNFNLAAHLGIRGAVAGFVSACASTSQAIGYASDEISLGRLRRVLVVGGEDLSMDSIFPFHGCAPSRATPTRPGLRGRSTATGTALSEPGARSPWFLRNPGPPARGGRPFTRSWRDGGSPATATMWPTPIPRAAALPWP